MLFAWPLSKLGGVGKGEGCRGATDKRFGGAGRETQRRSAKGGGGGEGEGMWRWVVILT